MSERSMKDVYKAVARITYELVSESHHAISESKSVPHTLWTPNLVRPH